MSLSSHIFCGLMRPIFVAKDYIKSTQVRQAVDALALEADEGRA